MSHTWDPDRYLAYADERGRPFVDLLARVHAETPSVVVDLGCGPGNLTALLADRWRGASVTGIDSSPEMIAAAREVEGIAWEVADLRDWARPDPLALRAPVDVLTALGMAVDAWETTYLHVLTGPDPVFTWVSGTGARPTLQALPDDLRPGFEAEFKRRLRAAYPERDGRVVLPFRRIFVVAQVPA